MDFQTVLGLWQMWTLALLPSGALYAFLKKAVPVPEAARRAMAVGLLTALKERDRNYALAGAAVASDEWVKRKRGLLVLAIVAGIGVTIGAFMLFPALAAWPAWAAITGGLAGAALLAASPY